MSEQPPATPRATAPPPAKRRGVSIASIIVLVLGLAVVLTAGWYAQELKAYVKLQVWNKKAPLVAIEAFGKALQANDQAAIEAAAPGTIVEQADGVIAKLKPPKAPPQMPSREAREALPKLPLTALKYRFEPTQEKVYVLVEGETNRIDFAVGQVGGSMKVVGFSPGAAK